MHPQAADAGHKLVCPDCKTVNVIPVYVEPAARQAAPDRVRGEYSVDAEALVERKSPAAPPPPWAIEDREPAPEPPRWVFFSGIYAFPWQSGVVARWASLTIGLFLVAACAWIAYGGLASGIDVRGGVTAAGALSLPVFFFSFWSLSFAAACMLVIVQETAEGATVIHEWPAADWREWVFKLLFMLQNFFLATVAGWGVSRTLALVGVEPTWQWFGFGLTTFLCLPFFLLSALETGSAFMPISLPILASLFRLWWGWLVFYLEAGLLLAFVAAATFFGAQVSLGISLVMAPFFAAFLLIYARLMGRLGWLIVDRLGSPAAIDHDDD